MNNRLLQSQDYMNMMNNNSIQHVHAVVCRSVSETAAQYGNCSLLFSAVDTNKNGYVGLHETIVAFAKTNAFDFDANIAPDVKIHQINCSECVDTSTMYYM